MTADAGAVRPPDEVAPRRRSNLADGAADAHLAEHGFTVLSPRLDRRGVEDLAQLYRGAVNEDWRDPSGRFLPSMLISRPEVRARLWDGVGKITRPSLQPLFRPGTTEVVGGSFVSKPASPHSVRDPHQDPTAFDESRHVGLSVWIPLSDSDTSNGTLFVLPGSHRMGNHVRPPDVDSFDDAVATIAVAESVPIELEAGQLLLVDGAVIHHSPPNGSGVERVAAICALGPVGAPMRYVRSEHGAHKGTADIYEVGVAFYRTGDLVNPDLGGAPLVERAPYRPASLAELVASRRTS